MLRKIIACLVVLLLCFSCSVESFDGSDTGSEQGSSGDANTKGKVKFSFAQDGMVPNTNQVLNLSRSSAVAETVVPEDARAVIVTIEDEDGNIVHDRLNIPLFNMNGYLITGPLDLYVGSYNLTEFLVLDEDDNVIYATPKEGSELAQAVNDPLPITFVVEKDEVTKVVPEVIEVKNCTPPDFGYVSFSFEVVEIFGFMITVFTFDETEFNWALTDAILKIKGDGELIYTWPLEAITNVVRVKDGYEEYELIVEKEGYSPWSKTYTADELKTNCDEVHPIKVLLMNKAIEFEEELKLGNETVDFPFIWVPNNEGTVSKLCTETGKEIARYWVSPGAGSPSRTTVDLEGNCWVGNRSVGTVVKIGLYEADTWIDRNGDGICQTSLDLNDDGDISGAELLPWGEDECVLYEVALNAGSEATYVPGTAPNTVYNSSGPRGITIDQNNNLWAGTYATRKYYNISGETGEILKIVDLPATHTPYGAVIDRNGILWSSGVHTKSVLRLDPADDSLQVINLGHIVYGLGLNYEGKLFASGWTDLKLTRIDITTGTVDWTKSIPELNQARGVACTKDNDVWVVSTANNTVYRFDSEGTLKASVPVGTSPTGVAVDAAGKVWACDYGDANIFRINPADNTVELTKGVLGSGGHYSYSDMTGVIGQIVKSTKNTWSLDFDSEAPNREWNNVSWDADMPQDTAIEVKIRTSNDNINWSDWEIAGNGEELTSTPDGRYANVEVTLEILDGTESPVLHKLTIK